MLNKLFLQNFKCYKKQNIDFSNLTVFSGINGSGKSTVIQAILFLRQLALTDQCKDAYGNLVANLNGPLVQFGSFNDLISNWVTNVDNEKIKLIAYNDSGASYSVSLKSLEKRNEDIVPRQMQILEIGEPISCIDSDDFVSDKYCEKLLENFVDDIGMVVLGLEKAYANGNKVTIKHRLEPGKMAYDEMKGCVIDDGSMSGFTIHSSCAILFDLNTIKEHNVRFNENVKFNEDGLFNIEYFLKARKAVYIDYEEVIYSYRANEQSATQTVDVLGEKFAQSMKNIREVLQFYAQDDNSLIEQINRREVSIALSKILYVASKEKINGKKVKELLSPSAVKEGLKYLDKKYMNFKKRVISMLMKLGFYGLIALALNTAKG